MRGRLPRGQKDSGFMDTKGRGIQVLGALLLFHNLIFPIKEVDWRSPPGRNWDLVHYQGSKGGGRMGLTGWEELPITRIGQKFQTRAGRP